jgi:hypothetical protein
MFLKVCPIAHLGSNTALVSGEKGGSEYKTRRPEFLSFQVGNTK